MVIWHKLLNVVFVINLNYFVVESLPNIVIVNNKPMAYKRKEDFAEIITVIEDDDSLKDENLYNLNNPKNKYETVDQKSSNIYKTSNFVTNKNFRGGLITKHNFTLHLPVKKNDEIINRYENSKFSSTFHASPLINSKQNQSLTTTTQTPPFILEPEIVSAIIYNNDIISIANSLNHSASHKKKPAKENSVVIVHSTPSPSTIVAPIFLAPTTTKATKISKTKKRKDFTTLPPDSNFHKHFIQNLDYYRKILNINCSNGAAMSKNATDAQSSDSENDVVEITPKPDSKIKDKYDEKDDDDKKKEDDDKKKEDDDKKKKKKKCKCKKKHHHHHHHKDSHEHDEHHDDHHHHHGHHGHHHHHHHDKESKESHEEHKPSYTYKPVPTHEYNPVAFHTIQTVAPQESHKITGIPTTYSHLHQHKHHIQPTSIVSPIKRITPVAPLHPIPAIPIPNKIDYFDPPEKLPPLGDEYEEVGGMFDTFYRAIESAFTTDKADHESADYDSKEYENEESSASEEYSESKGNDDDDDDYEENYSEDYEKKRRKRRDLLERKNILKSKALMPRKSLKTKIIITNEYDDDDDDDIQNVQESVNNQTALVSKKKKRGSKKEDNRSKSSEEYYDIIEDIMSFRDDFDSYSDEYDENLSKRHTNGSRRIKETVSIKKYQRDESPTNSITDGLLGMFFSYIEDLFFPSFFDMKDSSLRRKRPSNNYDGELYLKAKEAEVKTSEKPESHFKRPKRENEKLPWYFPTFLSSHNDAGSTEQLSSSNNEKYNSKNKKEVDGATEEITTTSSIEKMDETTAKAMPYDFFGMISKLLVSKKKQSKSISSRRIRKKVYTNYQLWRLFPMSKDDVTYLDEFRMSTDGNKIHWLKSPNIKDTADVVLPPSYVDTFKKFLSKGEIKYVVKIRNIQHAIKFENPRLNKRDQIEMELINGHPLTWYRYHSFANIQTYYDYLKRKYPTFVELVQIGWSFNGKPLTVVKISYPKQTLYDMKKPAIFILAGTAAHLWLPTACSTYILNSLVTNIANNDNFGKMIRKFDWYVLSLLNPDGYDYSMTVDRLWQKSRSRQFISNDNFISSAMNWLRISNSTEKVCYGVDMTKNFDSDWIEDESSGDNKCSDYYKGPHASSEPEIKLLSNFLLKHNKSIKLFINLDGYGRQILYPSSKLKQSGLDELNDMARSGLRNMKMHRNDERKYDVNNKNVDISSGTVESFAMHRAKIKYSYRIESMDNRQYSIFVPATSIEQNANELLDIIKGMIKYLENE